MDMATPASKTPSPEKEVLCALLDQEDIAVARIQGRGNFLNSVPFKKFADDLQATGHPAEFIVDMGACETLDSTFMGVLASVSLAQVRSGRPKVVVANANAHIRKLLKTLGLTSLLSIHEDEGNATSSKIVEAAESQLAPATSDPVSRVDQICHTLEAHRALANLGDENEVRFQSVIQILEQSLHNAEEGRPDF
jgi:anti-anti-sigma regulatory factor